MSEQPLVEVSWSEEDLKDILEMNTFEASEENLAELKSNLWLLEVENAMREAAFRVIHDAISVSKLTH